jgi:hypothetical protein
VRQKRRRSKKKRRQAGKPKNKMRSLREVALGGTVGTPKSRGLVRTVSKVEYVLTTVTVR